MRKGQSPPAECMEVSSTTSVVIPSNGVHDDEDPSVDGSGLIYGGSSSQHVPGEHLSHRIETDGDGVDSTVDFVSTDGVVENGDVDLNAAYSSQHHMMSFYHDHHVSSHEQQPLYLDQAQDDFNPGHPYMHQVQSSHAHQVLRVYHPMDSSAISHQERENMHWSSGHSFSHSDDLQVPNDYQPVPSVSGNRSQHVMPQEPMGCHSSHKLPHDNADVCLESPEHEMVISDVPVVSRARATLPSAFLSIDAVDDILSDIQPEIQVYGVFARKSIPQKTQFGPVEGVIMPYVPEAHRNQPQQNLIVFISDTLILDQSDENKSNWMRFVRMAGSLEEQNVVLVTKEQTQPNPENSHELITTTKFFFTTTRSINPREELKVWYSRDYAERFRLKLLEDDRSYENRNPIIFDGHQPLLNPQHAVPPVSDSIMMSSQAPYQPLISQEPLPPDPKGLDPGPSSSAVSPAVLPPAGHKLRNKIAKSQQQQLQLQKSQNSEISKPDAGKEPEVNSEGPVDRQSNVGPAIIQHSCETCGKSFPRFYSLRRHMIMHSGEKKFKCHVCLMSFSHVYNRNRHMKRHNPPLSSGINRRNLVMNGQRMSSSGVTKGILNSQNGQNDPKTINISKGGFRCKFCYKSFTCEERLVKHSAVHSTESLHKPYVCPFCSKRFLNNSALACHKKVHMTPKDEMRRYDCILCKETFECTQSRKDHIQTHMDPVSGQYSCSYCHKRFEEFSGVRKHIRAFHSDRQFPCPNCEKVFPRPDKLKLHMLRHSDHREFLCQSCGKQFKRKDKLKEHMVRMHAPDRDARLAAKVAAKAAAASSSSLNMNGHNGHHSRNCHSKRFVPKVSPNDYLRFIYKCHSCLLGFKRRGMLVNHLAKRHPETPPDAVPELNLPILKTTRDYYCQYCDKIYKSSSKRKSHILKNHPGKSLPISSRQKGTPTIPGLPNPTYSATVGSVTTHPHHCSWCHKQYASKAKLLQHQRKKHPERVAIHSRVRNTVQNHVIPLMHEQQQHQHQHNNHNQPLIALAPVESGSSLVSNQDQFGSDGSLQSSASLLMNSNLIAILGNIVGTSIPNVSGDTSADLQELLQSNTAAANDLLTQAMSELTNASNVNNQQQKQDLPTVNHDHHASHLQSHLQQHPSHHHMMTGDADLTWN